MGGYKLEVDNSNGNYRKLFLVISPVTIVRNGVVAERGDCLLTCEAK